jgi:hypothetical protein
MTNTRPTGDVATAFALISGATVLGGIALAFRKPNAPADRAQTTVRSARRLNCAAGTLAASVLVDSAIEHYRGNFHNKAMIMPLVTASLSLAASLHGTADRRGEAHIIRDLIYAGAGLTGLVGTGFHIYNISKKPGGLSWQNLFYSAPLGAPAAISLSGMLGFLSERLRDNPPNKPPTILGIPAGRVIGAMTSLGLMGTVGESGLLHFRGAYHNPAMYLPVTMPPVAAALLGASALGRSHTHRPMTRWWMRATALLGFAGTAFHAAGIGRSMGGWKNWRQNLVDGPPIPAPPSFTGLALAGLAALALLEDHPDD